MRKIRWLFFIIAIVGFDGIVSAGVITPTCTVSASALVFSLYDPTISSNNDGAGNITVTCSSVLPSVANFQISLSPGSSATVLNRSFVGVSPGFQYNLYTDATRSVVWGDGSGGSGTVSGSINTFLASTPRVLGVFGRIPAKQQVRAGTYTDNITVTVNY